MPRVSQWRGPRDRGPGPPRTEPPKRRPEGCFSLRRNRRAPATDFDSWDQANLKYHVANRDRAGWARGRAAEEIGTMGVPVEQAGGAQIEEKPANRAFAAL